MKKIFFIIGIVLLAVILIFGSLYAIDHKRMENNEHVVFSTWGKDYAPVEITRKEAINTVKKGLDPNRLMITNFDNPKVEEVVFKERPSICLVNEKIKVVGRELYKITFYTEQDGLLGPITEYVDKLSGEIIGGDYRE